MELIYQIFRNWKTSGLGTAGIIVTLCAYFGVGIDDKTAAAVVAVIVWVFTLVTKDADKSHTQQ